MRKEDVQKRILDIGIVPVIRASSAKLAITAAEAVLAGGIPVVEITMTVPGAIDVIRQLSRSLGTEIVAGAGTVLDSETAQRCLDAGAEFVVSPAFDAQTVEFVARRGKLIMPGALTPTEIVNAWKNGADFVKVFPCGNIGGPQYIKSLKAPLPHIPLVPTGGVTLANAGAFIRAGAAALGAGTDLVSEKALESGDVESITRNARLFLDAVHEGRHSD
jgi:2-dehydro-3-deoxyphosphogluconate aldolase/(4S)-4-hydroxy-2-oxoglutarate aldolase